MKKEFKDLCVIRANPSDYVARYGTSLKSSKDLPSFVLQIKPPAGIILAADYEQNSSYELEGDVEALQLVDLEQEGLTEYASFVKKLKQINNNNFNQQQLPSDTSTSNLNLTYNDGFSSMNSNNTSTLTRPASAIITDVFNSISKNSNTNSSNNIYKNNKMSLDEAETIAYKLNNHFGRKLNSQQVKELLIKLDKKNDGYVDIDEFKRAYE